MPTPSLKRQRPSQQDAPTTSVSNNIISRFLNQVALAYDHGEKYFPLTFTPEPLIKAMGVGADEFFNFPTDDQGGEHWVVARRKQIFKHLFALMDALDAQNVDEGLKEEGLVLSRLFIAGFVVFLGSVGWGALIDDDLLVCSIACQYYSDRKLSALDTAAVYHRFADRLADIYVSSLTFVTQCVTCLLKRVHCLNIHQSAVAPFIKGENSSPPRGGNAAVAITPEQHALTSRMTKLLSLVIQRIACWPSPLLHSRYSLLVLKDPYLTKKIWRDLKQPEYRLQARVAADVRQEIGSVTPLTWLSLVHLVAYSDVNSFKMFQRGVSIPSKAPLTDLTLNSRSADPEAPFPPLDRLAIRTRTKYKFTFPTTSAIRETFYAWNYLTTATRMFCQEQWRDELSWSKAFDPVKAAEVCKPIDFIWRTAIVQGQMDSNFALRHILRVVSACIRERRDNVYLSDKVLNDELPAKPMSIGNININAATLLTHAITVFGPSAIRKEFSRLLMWNRDLMLTKLAFDNDNLLSLVTADNPTNPPAAINTTPQVIPENPIVVDDPLITILEKKSLAMPIQPSRIATSEIQTPNENMRLPNKIFTPDSALNASGIGICSAIFIELGILDFDTVWKLLPPNDFVLKLVSKIHKLSLTNSAAKASYIEKVEEYDFELVSELWFKTQLVRYFSDIQKRDSMDVLMHCVCPRLELLAGAVELNLKIVSTRIIAKFEELGFPYYLSRIIRRAFGNLIGSTNDMTSSPAVLGWSRGSHWVSRRCDQANGVLECYSVMRGWILGNAEVVSIVCEELKKRDSDDVADEDGLLVGVLTALLLLPTPAEIPLAPTSSSQPMPYARAGDTVSHQVSDIIWELIQDWPVERRYRVYAHFYFRKMKELEIRYLCKQDRSRVNKSLKKITASSSPSLTRSWDNNKADKIISTAVCRSAMNNPFETFSCILYNAELFDSMWLVTALDYLRVLTRLACDVLLFMIIERQQTQSSSAKRVRNLSLFAARYLRKYPWVTPKPLIMSLCGGILYGAGGSYLPSCSIAEPPAPPSLSSISSDHLYLCDLLTWLGGCSQTSMIEISDMQLNCYFGGPVLRAIGLGDEAIRQEELKPGARMCKNNLRDVLLELNVFRSLVYGLGKMNINMTMNEQENLGKTDDERLIKILESSQSLHSTLAHLLHFVIAPAPLAVSKEENVTTLPSRAYRIFPAQLWIESFKTLPANVVWQLIRWASPPCLVNVDSPCASYSEMKWFTRSSDAEIDQFLQFANSKKPVGITLQGFLTFWLLQTGDLKNPDDEYNLFINSSEKLSSQLGGACDKRKISDYQEALVKENEVKQASTSAVTEWFSRNAGHFTTSADDEAAEAITSIITQLVVPRSAWSVADALFSYQWLSLAVKAEALNVAGVTACLVCATLPAIFGATDIEADSLGLLVSIWLGSLSELVQSADEVRLLLNAESVLIENLKRVKPTWYTGRRILRLLNQLCNVLPASRPGYEAVMMLIELIKNALNENREISSMVKALRRRMSKRTVTYTQELNTIFPQNTSQPPT